MKSLVVLVEFSIRSESREEFRRLINENATASLREPGCRRFDVLAPDGEHGDRITLYEIYDDDASFKEHMKTEHFHAFDSASAPHILERNIRLLRFVES